MDAMAIEDTTTLVPAMQQNGLYGTLGKDVIDFGSKDARDIIRTSWKKLTQYVDTNNVQDISEELR